jgi:glycerol-3-phosphate dehydrogenase (NAD(P)+)
MTRLAILGAGSWGIAVSVLLHGNKHEITLWEFNKSECDNLKKFRELPSKLPGITIPLEIAIINDLKQALTDADAIILAVPSHIIRQVAKSVAPLITAQNQFILHLAKGIENNTLCRMSEVLLQELPNQYSEHIAVLSGPSHAEEVARNIPTTVVVGATNHQIANRVQAIFATPTFRVYTSCDVIGVELGGSLKNIIAIAAGIAQGMGLGDNTLGALMTRGLAEMVRLGRKMGADPLTFSGLSGIGDLITTCISKHSRNRHVGEQLGKGRKLAEILDTMTMVAEGVKTTLSAFELSRIHNVEMPITAAMYEILFADKDPRRALYELMTRAPKPEIWT